MSAYATDSIFEYYIFISVDRIDKVSKVINCVINEINILNKHTFLVIAITSVMCNLEVTNSSTPNEIINLFMQNSIFNNYDN